MLFDDGLNYRSVFLQVGIYIFYIDFSHGIDRWLGLSMQPLHGRFLDLRLDLGDTRLNVSLLPRTTHDCGVLLLDRHLLGTAKHIQRVAYRSEAQAPELARSSFPPHSSQKRPQARDAGRCARLYSC